MLIFHTHNMGVENKYWPSLFAKLPCFSELGTYAVCVFFCISGFLILQTLPKNKSIGQFALNRVKRIYPVFFILNLIFFAVGPFINYEWMGKMKHHPVALLGHFISNSLFLPGIFKLPIAQKNAWSLSYEALFYLLAAVCFFSYRKYKFITVIGLAVAAFTIYKHPNATFFLVGIFWCYQLSNERLRPLLVGPVGLIALGLGLWGYYISPYLALVPVLILFGTIATEQGWLSQFLRLPIWQFLGAISYSLYLIHPFVLDPLRRILGKVGSKSLDGAAFIILGPALAILVSYLSYLYIEKRLTNRLFPRPTKPSPVISTEAA